MAFRTDEESTKRSTTTGNIFGNTWVCQSHFHNTVKESKVRLQYTHTHAGLPAIVPGRPGLTVFAWLYIFMDTIPPCPSKAGKGTTGEEREVEKQPIPCGVIGAEIIRPDPSCHWPVLKTSTGTHPFFNHQQTPDGWDVAHFYVCSQTSVSAK